MKSRSDDPRYRHWTWLHWVVRLRLHWVVRLRLHWVVRLRLHWVVRLRISRSPR